MASVGKASATTSMDIIKANCASTASCSPDVLAQLRDLLNPPTTAASKAKITTSKASTKATKVLASANSKGNKAAKTVTATTKPTTGIVVPCKAVLTPQERTKLATEIVNVTLKTLSSALKSTAPGTAHQHGSKEIAKNAGAKPKKVVSTSKSTATSVSAKKLPTGDQYIAECCRVAISFLHDSPKEPLTSNPENFAIPLAHANLIAKLLSLSMHDAAMKETALLKRRLSGVSAKGEATAKTPILSLLDWREATIAEGAIHVTITCQLHSLRLMVAAKKLEAIARLQEYLSFVNCPEQLIKRQAKQSLPKALKNLDALAGIVTSCAQALAASDDDNPRRMYLVFQLQVKGVEYTLLAASLQDGDIKRKALVMSLEMAFRCLNAFSRKATTELLKDTYPFVKERVDCLLPSLSDLISSETETPIISKFVDIYRLLGNFAQDAAAWEDGFLWNEESIKLLTLRPNSSAARAAVILRSGTLALKQFSFSSTTEAEISARASAALEALKGSISGSADDTDWLIQEVLLLRRAAVSITAKSKIEESDVTKICRNIVFATITFYKKCRSANIPLAPTPAKAEKLALSAVECAVAIIKTTFNPAADDSWENADQRLQECFGLGKADADIIEEAQNGASIFERVSSAYAHISVIYRREGDSGLAQAIAAMKRSVKAVQDRTLPEKAASNLPEKLYRLAEYCFQDGSISKAEEYVNQSLSSMVESGCFATALDLPLHAAKTPTTAIIFKALRLRTVCCVQMGRTDALWDDKSLDTDVRGKLLECQVNVMSGLSDTYSKAAASSGLKYILDTIYTPERPIRRARLILQYLALAIENPDRVGYDEALRLGADAAKTLGSGKASLQLDAHLNSQFEITTAMIFLTMGLLSFAHGVQKVEYIQLGLDFLVPLLESCTTEEELVGKVDDLGTLDKHLCTIVELLEAKGLGNLRVKAMKAMIRFCELSGKSTQESLKWQTTLGLQYHRIGHSGKAGLALARVEVRMNKEESFQGEVKLRWYLAYSEYLAGIGNVDKGLESFAKTAALFNPEAVLANSRAERKIMSTFLVGNACYVLSLLLFEKGNASEALLHAKRSVRLIQRVWAALENLSTRSDNDHVKAITKGIEALSTKDSDKPKIHSTTMEALRGRQLWPAVQCLYSYMTHLSAVYWHQGMCREADYYMGQALNIAEVVEAVPNRIHALALYGDLKVRQGQTDAGHELIEKAWRLRSQMNENFKELVTLDLISGDLRRRRQAWEEEYKYYEQAEGTLKMLMDEFKSSSEDLEKLAEGMSQLSTTDAVATTTSRRGKGQSKPTRAKSVSKKALAKAPASKKTPTKEQVVEESALLSRMKGDILRRKALNMAVQNESDLADALLQQAASLPGGIREFVSQHLASARSILIQAQAAIESDRSFCVLQESAIPIPSILTASAPLVTPAKPKKGRSKNVSNETSNHIVELLVAARDHLVGVQDPASKHCSSTTAAEIASLITGIMVLIAAISPERADASALTAYYAEKSRGLASLREHQAVAVEKEEAAQKEDLGWPVQAAVSDEGLSMEYADFQRDYVDIIPSRWAAVSMCLGENKTEIMITRYQQGQTPFVLRLPFERHLFDDTDEEALEFLEVEDKLQEIYANANSSTHSAKEKTTKAARATWWKEREELDGELKELLEEIESKWLCGFKGMLSQGPRHNDLIAKFGASLNRILNKHLPTRRKKNAKSAVANLDPRILELFVTVGDPRDEDIDLEQPLQDLMQFVVDVLKFHGEENAYNEIDMDDVVVDLTEALRAYHELSSKTSSEPDIIINHTVLILDKALQAFPWESLPYLSGHSISRLPSLASLRERLLMQSTSTSEEQQGYMVDRCRGSYILNPSNDLVSTQKMMKDDLQRLENWEGIVQRPPKEDEFKKALEEKDVLMYFGHGSGAQYIPGRVIKKLDKCAVTLLLGCSSGALKHAGEFEPYGMPVNYLHGGCPSLVALLWDVTDKDIDKFSVTMLQKWGLFSSEDDSQPRMSLTAAVAEGRKMCKLRYLNGAAPVVYGIPAYIS